MKITMTAIEARPLRFAGVSAWAAETLFLASTILLPMVAHTFKWPVFVVLPMFWGVMIAGVVYGWKAGLLLGLLSPVLNHLLTGMPIASLVPILTMELSLYGAIPSLFRTKVYRGPGSMFVGIAAGVVVGRFVSFAGRTVLFGGGEETMAWLTGPFLMGLPMQVLQVFLVPVIGGAIIRVFRSAAEE